jgi:hypothetical protein
MKFSTRLLHQLNNLPESIKLPKGWIPMNPYTDFEQAAKLSVRFYQKFFNDYNSRCLLFGINPFKWGAGLTGVPFTDARRLTEYCGISFHGKASSERSSQFIYEIINQLGGPELFYKQFYFNWFCPLGFVKEGSRNKNGYAYYDDRELADSARMLIIDNIGAQLKIGARSDVCFVIGKGKNEAFIRSLNEEHGFFKKIIGLEHPGFIMRYHSADIPGYKNKYLHELNSV